MYLSCLSFHSLHYLSLALIGKLTKEESIMLFFLLLQENPKTKMSKD